MKIEYSSYVETKDKPGYVWFVGDEYVLESWSVFRKKVDAEKHYNNLNWKHPTYFIQLEVK